VGSLRDLQAGRAVDPIWHNAKGAAVYRAAALYHAHCMRVEGNDEHTTEQRYTGTQT
jgi:hypothetical protein